MAAKVPPAQSSQQSATSPYSDRPSEVIPPQSTKSENGPPPPLTSGASHLDSTVESTVPMSAIRDSWQQDSQVADTSQPEALRNSLPYSRFFELPRELRDIIYQYAIGTATRVRLRDKHRETKRLDLVRGVHSMQPEYPLGRNIRAPLKAIKWRRCLMGLFLVSKAIWIEVRDLLYNSITFEFESPSQTQAFLQNVPQVDLERITSIVIEHHDMAFVFNDGARNQDHRRDEREMWWSVVRCLPNVQHLKIDMGDMGYDGIVPDYACHPYELNGERFDTDRFDMPWIQDLMVFREFQNLETVQVVFREYGDKNMRDMWRYYGYEIPLPLPPNTAKNTVIARWAAWYKALQKSFGEAIGKVILNEEFPYDDHLDLLEWFYDWRWEPYEITGLYQTKKGRGHRMKFCGKWVWV